MPLTTFTTVSQADLAKALLQLQFFPNVKPSHEEMPPLFESTTFTKAIADRLRTYQLGSGQHADFVAFRSRRFDGLVRRMGLPHPVAYARLFRHIHDHWIDLSAFLDSPESMIRPSIRGRDERIIVMDYGSPESKVVRSTRAAQSKRYVLKADISNCFPSMYSHSIDWALRGFAAAKAGSSNAWEAKLDKYVRDCHDRETKGLMIGPAISNLISEIVLQRIDETLRSSGHKFVRYIDDYTAFFSSRDEAEGFVALLDRALSDYRLILNSRKTSITSLREGFGDPWINDIQSHIPKGKGAVAAVRFLQHCELLAQRVPEHSVLLYGVKTLLSKRRCPELTRKAQRPPAVADLAVLDELVRINYFHPHLSCFVVRQMSYVRPLLRADDKDRLAQVLRRQMLEAARRAETDTVIWLLYAIRKLLRRPIPVTELKVLIGLDDDLIWLAVACTSKYGRAHVTKRVSGLGAADKSTCERHWLSRYELFRAGDLKVASLNTSCERPWFVEARRLGLRFSTLDR